MVKIKGSRDYVINKKADKEPNSVSTLFRSQPLQFLEKDKKDEEWAKLNVDWLEWYGLKELRIRSPRLLKNYKLLAGEVDIDEYTSVESQDLDPIKVLSEKQERVLDIKNYPLISKLCSVILGEFAARNTDVVYFSTDDSTYNEILEKKKQMVEDVLLNNALLRLREEAKRLHPELSEEELDRYVGQVSKEQLKQLPEIEGFFRKDFRTIYEIWAQKLHKHDYERFNFHELEQQAVRDLLATGREIWHIMMLDNDYHIELWNPLYTFYYKNPNEKYLSNASFIGKMELLTINDVISRYGHLMDSEQIDRLVSAFPVLAGNYLSGPRFNDGNYFDTYNLENNDISKTGSLAFKKLVGMMDFTLSNVDILNYLISSTELVQDRTLYNFLRVTTCYWVSYKKVGVVTKIDDAGIKKVYLVEDDYKPVLNPIYNKKYISEKSAMTLVYGEHIDWVWVKEVWSGIKIGPNMPTWYGLKSPFQPIYLGINNSKPSPLPFQLKGDITPFGAKLPVEGIVLSDRNTAVISVVDLLKPYQIGYNIVNNQIMELLADEIGNVVLMDINAFPKHNLMEDTGLHPYMAAYLAMKNFNILPVDTSVKNTETPLHFNQYTKLDLSQTERIVSRIQIANYFQQEALNVLGIHPERMLRPIGTDSKSDNQTKTAVNMYNITERLFVEHCDNFMPRVHELRTNVAQYYYSMKPSFRLKTLTDTYEREVLSIDGPDFLLRDIGVFVGTKVNHRMVLENIKRAVLQNPNMGATIFDIGDVMKSDTLKSLQDVMVKIRERREQEVRQQLEHEEKMKQMELENLNKQKQLDRDLEAKMAELEARKDILVAQIRASSLTALKDVNMNNQSDWIEYMNQLEKSSQYRDLMDIKQQTLEHKKDLTRQKMDIEREKIRAQQRIKELELQIAMENKNKYDILANKTDKNKEKE